MISPLRVGITGGIGSGKTTVCQIFATLGVPIYYADAAAKRLMVEEAGLVEKLRQLLGNETYRPDGSLDRTYVAQQIFADPRKRAAVNALVHPAVGIDSLHWHQRQTTPYTLYEAALLYESGGYQHLDRMIVVTAPESVRIDRVVLRDQLAPADVQARLASQWPESDKVARADHIIYNDGRQRLIPQVLELHRQLTIISKAR